MKKSIGLLSALVVSTTFIVNCQKAPDKRRVRPSGGAGAGAQSDVMSEKSKLPTKVCSKEILDLIRGIYTNEAALNKSVITAESTEVEKDAQKKLGVDTLSKCDDVIVLLKAEENEACYRDNGVKDLSNAYTTANMQNKCEVIGTKLKSEVQLDNAYADSAKAKEKVAQDAKQVESELIGKSLKMSKEARQLVLSGNTDGGKFLVEGEIGSSDSSLDKALAASSTVCTFLGKGLQIDENIETTLKITQTSPAEKADLLALRADFKGKATVLTTEVAQDEKESELISLLCLNLDSAKLSVDAIKKALGSGIASAPTQVTTEVTDGASEAVSSSSTASATTHTAADLAAAQPAGSPQQKNLEAGTAQMVANANKATDQKVAEQKVATAAKQEEKKEEKVEAKAEVKIEEKKTSTDDVAMLKEKAERLEKEATEAEAEVKNLEIPPQAKPEDIEQAKAKARCTRDAANTAKAEYEAAAKKS